MAMMSVVTPGQLITQFDSLPPGRIAAIVMDCVFFGSWFLTADQHVVSVLEVGITVDPRRSFFRLSVANDAGVMYAGSD